MKNFTFAHSNIFICCDERFLLFFVQYIWRAQRCVCVCVCVLNEFWSIHLLIRIETYLRVQTVLLSGCFFLYRLHFDGEDDFFSVSVCLSSNFVQEKSHWIPFSELVHSMFWFSIYISSVFFFFACLLLVRTHDFNSILIYEKKHSIHGFLLGVNHVKWLFNNSIISAHWIGVKLLCRKKEIGKESWLTHRIDGISPKYITNNRWDNRTILFLFLIKLSIWTCLCTNFFFPLNYYLYCL